eukprot:CAMPEP_0117523294 /NCGR_PEP_ID=MMETSP0784-20121206/34654_1 /TAXON_ID=39447 /ORGANISM="" /LENGTH=396 /DNA_ID=CAMNT_0005319403 /DNA_START=167 /DNA_END=1358 /DNA_ORIENTATION=-
MADAQLGAAAESIQFRDHGLVLRIIEAIQTLQQQHEACMAAGFKPCSPEAAPFKDSVLLGDALCFNVDGARCAHTGSCVFADKTFKLQMKDAFLQREDFFEQLRVVLPDLFVSSRRVPLPPPHWKRLWHVLPASFEALEQQVAMTIEQAFWSMDLDVHKSPHLNSSPTDEEVTNAQLACMSDEQWMIQYDLDEKIRASKTRLTQNGKPKTKKTQRRRRQSEVNCTELVDEAVPEYSTFVSSACKITEGPADEIEQLHGHALLLDKDFEFQDLSEACSTCCSAAALDGTQELQQSTVTTTPDLTVPSCMNAAPLRMFAEGDDYGDLKGVGTTCPSEDESEDPRGTGMLVPFPDVPTETFLPKFCGASDGCHPYAVELEPLFSQRLLAFGPPPGLERP